MNNKLNKRLATDEMATISELVIGCREGSFGEIVQAISRLKCQAIKHEENKQVELLFEACSELSELVESIRFDVNSEEKEQQATA